MYISTITEILNGKLINTPSILMFNSVAFGLKEIKRGALFFAKDSSEIELALALGAYCVVFEGKINNINTDSALIEVDSIKNALIRYLKYFLLDKKIELYLVSNIELEIIRALCRDESVRFVDDDLHLFARELIGSNQNIIFFSANKALVKTIYKDYKFLIKEAILENLKERLFYIEFDFNNTHFALNLMAPFLDELKRVLHILENKKLKNEATISSFSFELVFVNRFIEVVDNSEMVLILTDDAEIFHRVLEFLETKAKYAKRVYIVPKNQKLQNENFIFYNTQSEILDILNSCKFNFALIFRDKELSFISVSKRVQKRLF